MIMGFIFQDILLDIIWVNLIRTEPCSPSLGIIVFIGKSSPNGRKIHVTEIL
jgi:hypothetical protein